MNKLFQILTLAILTLASNPSPAQLDQTLDINRSESVAHSATPGGRVRVIITKHNPKLSRPKSQRPLVQLIRLSADDDIDYYAQLPDLQVGYRRPELVNQTVNVDDDISDEIKIRLLLARIRALEAYDKKWG